MVQCKRRISEVLLTELEVSQVLRVTQSTLRRWRAEKRGPSFVVTPRRKSRRIQYRGAAIKNWLAMHRAAETVEVSSPEIGCDKRVY